VRSAVPVLVGDGQALTFSFPLPVLSPSPHDPGTPCCSQFVNPKAAITSRLWTPTDLLLSGFAWTSMLVGALINFTLNGALQAHIHAERDFIGVYSALTNSSSATLGAANGAEQHLYKAVSPHDSAVVTDLLAVTILVTFFSTLGVSCAPLLCSLLLAKSFVSFYPVFRWLFVC
jgi:hypothetical protein